MKLFRRTKWKPTQKLRKEDIPFLLAEYRISKNTENILLSFCISMLAIAAAAFAFYLNNPDPRLENVMLIGALGFFLFLVSAIYFELRASKIAKVLEIEKRLKRYGIRD